MSPGRLAATLVANGRRDGAVARARKALRLLEGRTSAAGRRLRAEIAPDLDESGAE